MTAPLAPVIERIADVIATRLRSIKRENGYTLDVGDVVRPTRTGGTVTPRGGDIELIQEDSTRNNELDFPGNPPGIAFDATFSIKCLVRKSDKSDEPRSTGENEIAAAAMKAVRVDANWYSMGGLALIADFGDPSPFDTSTGDHAGVSVPLIVTYRVREDDHTQTR